MLADAMHLAIDVEAFAKALEQASGKGEAWRGAVVNSISQGAGVELLTRVADLGDDAVSDVFWQSVVEFDQTPPEGCVPLIEPGS
jgi:hypothetical protein